MKPSLLVDGHIYGGLLIAAIGAGLLHLGAGLLVLGLGLVALAFAPSGRGAP